MSNVLDIKKQKVDEIKENIENAQSIVIVEYRGLNVKEVTDLRKQFRDQDVQYKVYKNTLTGIALKDLGYEGFEEYLSGPNGFVFSNEDLSQGAKIAKDFAKEHDKLIIKGGLLEGDVLDKEQVLALANLPSKDQLLAQVVYTLNAPIASLAQALNQINGKLVYALGDLKDKANEANVETLSELVAE